MWRLEKTQGGQRGPLAYWLAQKHEIVGQARARLAQNSYSALKRVSCGFRRGTLTLHGRLPNFYLKQVAQTAVAGIDGVERIENQIEVG